MDALDEARRRLPWLATLMRRHEDAEDEIKKRLAGAEREDRRAAAILLINQEDVPPWADGILAAMSRRYLGWTSDQVDMLLRRAVGGRRSSTFCGDGGRIQGSSGCS